MTKNSRDLATIGLIVAAAIVVMAVWNSLLKSPGSITTTTPVSSNHQIESGLLRLANSNIVSERVAAARFLGGLPAKSSNMIQALGKALTDDEDAQVRAAVASSIGNSRRKMSAEQSVVVNEPQMLEIMLHAYLKENDIAVRQAIVLSAAEFNNPLAGELIAMALEDHDSSVREFAHRAKVTRNARLLRLRMVSVSTS